MQAVMGLSARAAYVKAWLAGALLACAAGAAFASKTPEEAAQGFYGWVLAHPMWSLSSNRDRARLEALLAPEIVKLLRDAGTTEQRCLRAAPKNEKPLNVEGDIFVGNYEGATEAAYGRVRIDGETAQVEAHLIYVDRRFPKAHPHRTVAWRDTLDLRLADGAWRIQNVRYEQGRSLALALQGYIDEGARVCGAR
jgi:hypothetical protein